jgi:hypothetical protein
MNKRYKTQWTGQFAVAAELTRRGYLVAIPLGNLPARDLQCESPSGKSFSVQVKSLSSKTFFPLQKNFLEKEKKNLYFVFVYIPEKYNQPLEYFILSHKQLLNVWKKEKKKQIGKPHKEWAEGVFYKALFDFKNRWEILPN